MTGGRVRSKSMGSLVVVRIDAIAELVAAAQGGEGRRSPGRQAIEGPQAANRDSRRGATTAAASRCDEDRGAATASVGEASTARRRRDHDHGQRSEDHGRHRCPSSDHMAPPRQGDHHGIRDGHGEGRQPRTLRAVSGQGGSSCHSRITCMATRTNASRKKLPSGLSKPCRRSRSGASAGRRPRGPGARARESATVPNRQRDAGGQHSTEEDADTERRGRPESLGADQEPTGPVQPRARDERDVLGIAECSTAT